uniref:Uncharacterized protein n=1 Tax=Timema monikensis TaxID=170555 RepID=A0A7R9E099_9NEOP|nr:unnamed protein product [Timema monikensis]
MIHATSVLDDNCMLHFLTWCCPASSGPPLQDTFLHFHSQTVWFRSTRSANPSYLEFPLSHHTENREVANQEVTQITPYHETYRMYRHRHEKCIKLKYSSMSNPQRWARELSVGLTWPSWLVTGGSSLKRLDRTTRSEREELLREQLLPRTCQTNRPGWPKKYISVPVIIVVPGANILVPNLQQIKSQ